MEISVSNNISMIPMETETTNANPLELKPDVSNHLMTTPSVVGEKRKASDEDDVIMEAELAAPLKKARFSGGKNGGGESGEMKRVAEIVMVLSAMREIRGGKKPTTFEEELMSEARERLAKMCEKLAPLDVIPKDAIKVVTDDLGLRKSGGELRGGYRPVRMTIKEKMEIAKTKMEDSKKFAAQAVQYSSQPPQAGISGKTESSNLLSSATPRFLPEKQVGFGAVSPMVNVSAQASTSSSNQAFVNEIKSSIASRGLQRNPYDINMSLSMPRKDSTHYGLDGKPNGSTYASQGRGIGVDHTTRVPHNPPEMRSSQPTIQAARDLNSKPPSNVHQPPQAIKPTQVPSARLKHIECSLEIQKYLQPATLKHTHWIPPSKDYMNKSLTCQRCKATTIEIETVLVCDACEKGSHKNCLPPQFQLHNKNNDWFCPSCLASSGGKPFPPKYGRVTRTTNPPRAPAVTVGTHVQSSAVKKVEMPNDKIQNQKLASNGNPDSSVGLDTKSRLLKTKELELKAPLSNIKPSPSERVGVVSSPLPSYPVKESSEQLGQNCEASSLDSQKPILNPRILDTGVGIDHKLPKAEMTVPDAIFSQMMCPEVQRSDIKDTFECKPERDIIQDDNTVDHPVSAVANGIVRDHIASSLEVMHSVEWVGDPIRNTDGKTFYSSCRIKEIEYKLQEHAFIYSKSSNLRPSKFQAFWEDAKTNIKWASVKMCYFPLDLPIVVGKPSTPEDYEVYESNHVSTTIRVDLIQGPCEVLSPNKFKEENERRSLPGHEANIRLKPLFVCKWFYDEPTSSFSAVTD